MASGTKSDLLSGSPDGHGYFNGSRGSYSAASLERSGSFREGGDSYASFPVSSSSRSPAVDSVTLLQSLAMDPRTTTLDQKTSRIDVKKINKFHIWNITRRVDIDHMYRTQFSLFC